MRATRVQDPTEVGFEAAFRLLNPTEKAKAPQTIWICGDPALLRTGLRVSVVGTRKPTELGRRRAAKVTRLLVGTGATVVSGLARGIDAVAHGTALRLGGKTIAVLGTPLDRYYPAENRSLQQLIMRDHLAISMRPPGSGTRPWHFPERNRLMALISDATVIVEAGETSGTISQAWEAIRLGRQLLIPSSLADQKAELRWVEQILEYGVEVFSDENELLEALPPAPEPDLAIAL